MLKIMNKINDINDYFLKKLNWNKNWNL